MSMLSNFINSFKTESNASIIEAILAGQKAIFEDSALQRYNQNASEIASNYGNNILALLQNSARELEGRYTEDTEPELDGNITCNVRYVPNMRHTDEDKFGFSFTEDPLKKTEYTPPVPVVKAPVIPAVFQRLKPSVYKDETSTFSDRFR